MTPAYQLTAPSAHKIRPTLNNSEMSSLQATATDLETMISNTKKYLTSPHCDLSDRSRLESFIDDLERQLDDVRRQMEQQTA